MSNPLQLTHLNKWAILDKNTRLTYRQFQSLVISCQKNLISFDTIALIPKKNIKTVIFLFAAIRQGLSICLLNEKNPLATNEEIVKKIGGTFIDSPDLFIHRKPKDQKSHSNFYKAKLFIPTSGSTAEPKIAILTYKNMYFNALEAIRKTSLTQNDCYALSLPLHHVGGLSILFRTFMAKASLYIPEKKTSLDQTPTNFASLVPTQLIRLLPKMKTLQRNYKCLLIGGAYLSPYIYRKAKKLPLYLTYGMTEASSQILISNKPVLINDHYYLGWPHKHCEMKLTSDGEITVRGKSVFLKYFGENLTQNWFATKDLAYFSEKFGYSFHARKDRLFISGGENIYPEEIERAIHQCSLFDEVIVLAVDDDKFGKRPIAFVRSKNFDQNGLINDLKKILPKYKIPMHFYNLSKYPSSYMKWTKAKLKKIAIMQIFSL